MSAVEADLLARKDPDAWLRFALERLDEYGLVLDSDSALPSWPSLVVERPVSGSWWADPDVHLINRLGSMFVSHQDVLNVVLVSAKRTCIHRRLWPAFLSVAVAIDAWKFERLNPAALTMWDRLRQDRILHADDPGLFSRSTVENGRLMRQLEGRLLCAGGDVHTARGSHAKFVVMWDRWMAERKLSAPDLPSAAGRNQLDECLNELNRRFGGHGKLPWWPATRRS